MTGLPETLSIEDLFAAAANAEAVRKIRKYLDSLVDAVAWCDTQRGGLCSTCVERRHIVSMIRALLPVAGEVIPVDDRDLQFGGSDSGN